MVPIYLGWEIYDGNYAGGYYLYIDFKAEPYGQCTFYIGSPSSGDSGTLYFSSEYDCKALIENLGELQTYWVNSLKNVRALKWGIVHSCSLRDCKTAGGQSWWSEINSLIWLPALVNLF